MIAIDFSKIQIGDRLVRVGMVGFLTRHHAIYMGLRGEGHVVAENQFGHGVRYMNLESFLASGELIRIDYNYYSQSDQVQITNKVNQRLGKRYNFIFYNCEHFVNEVLIGIASSRQVQYAVTLLTTLSFLYQTQKAAITKPFTKDNYTG